MEKILVFNGWGYKSVIWNSFVNEAYGLFSRKRDVSNVQTVYAWSLGVLEFLENVDAFKSLTTVHLFSPCLSFIERKNSSGTQPETVKQMIAGLSKSPKAVLTRFHKQSKSKLSRDHLDRDSLNLRSGLEALLEFDFTEKRVQFPVDTHLYAAKDDPIITLRQSQDFATKHSLPLKIYDTFSHSFFLEEGFDK